MVDDRELTESRIRRFTRDQLGPAVSRETAPVTITAYRVPGEPISPHEAIREQAAQYVPIEVGAPLGRAWSTTWLHVTGTVPAQWAADGTSAPELIVDLAVTGQPGFQAEALVFTPDGVPATAITPCHRCLPVAPGEELDYYLECTATPMVPGDWTVAPTPLADLATIPEEKLSTISELQLIRRDVRIWDLTEDFRALIGLMVSLPETSQRRHEILRALETACGIADPDDLPGTVDAARAVLRPVLESPAQGSALTVLAIGHAHIGSAWLWPVRERVRTVARTFSIVCALLESDPDLTVAASSAQQFAWLKDRYPELFARIQGHVAAGRFVPVGGMWVEADTTMPGSEALARQFVAGKRFFLKEFGVETRETWLPDSSGCSAALPQIAALAGQDDVLARKVSRNQASSVPHHTFRWEGIDGTSVFTHVPPAGTDNGMLSGEELAHFERSFTEKGRSRIGIDLVGWGGGGPTREMMAAGRRAADLDGSPKVEFGTSQEFFDRARTEYPDAPAWNGELLLGQHRGSCSAQPGTAQGNRRSEHLLHEAEFLASLAAIRAGFEYPYQELATLWENTLLGQFHDILPGSSSSWVHREVEQEHAATAERAEAVIFGALAALGDGAGAPGAEGADVPGSAGTGGPRLLLNTAPVPRRGIPAYGVGAVGGNPEGVVVIREGETISVENSALRAVLDSSGAISSLLDRTTGRESIAPGARGALLQLHRDTPTAGDAWDSDEFSRHVVRDLETPTGVEVTEEGAGVRVSFSYSTAAAEGADTSGVTGAGSMIVKTYVLRPEDTSLEIVHDIDWRERRKTLKLAFGFDVRAASMSSETQFGHIDRPIPVNATGDVARSETCAHRWVHLAEGGYGVAIANDSTYGHDVLRTLREADGGTTTTTRLTLVRAPEFPDSGADRGRYTLRVAVRPGADITEAIEEGYRLNLPEREVSSPVATTASSPLVTVDGPSVLVETVKLAEDRSGDLVVRLYESAGARASARVQLDAELGGGEASVVDLLERPFAADAPAFRSALERTEDGPGGTRTGGVELAFHPFEIKTLRITRRG